MRSFLPERNFSTKVKAAGTPVAGDRKGDGADETFYPPRNLHASIVAKQILALVMSYVLIFSSAITFTSATLHAQTVDRPETPKLKISTGEAVLRTTEPPIKNLPDLEEMKRKGKENDDAGKIHKAKTEAERLPQAVRCRPADTPCQEYWKKQGKPSSNIGLLTPSEMQTNSFTNLMAANQQPFDLFANIFSTSDAPQGGISYRPPTTDHRPLAPFPASRTPLAMMQSGVTYGSWQTELAQRRNETGSDSLFSGNYHWSVPIVGLPGRAGHDLNLSLSYNSHVWVKMTGGMELDGYHFLTSNPGTGFSIGLPLLQSTPHYTRNNLTAYLLTMPSGQQIELIRRTGSAGGASSFQIYESQDGSLLRLTVAAGDRQLYFPNGTRIQFNGNSQLQYIQDRNGNQITATYDPNNGLMNKITDTLGREITFEYNAYFLISDIKRTRLNESNQSETITLAHFGYADVPISTNPNWGIYQGTLLPMLKSVQLASGSVYNFEYTSYAQVRLIQHYAPLTTTSNPNNLTTDYRLVSATSYNFPSTTTPTNNAAQTDCPRFTKRLDDAADWYSGVTTNYLRSGNYGEVTAPNGAKTREYYLSGADWSDGLIFKTELSDVNTLTLKRTTLTSWGLGGYPVRGPIVTDATVTDNENGSARYSQFEYNSYNLPTASYTFKGSTLLQKTTTDYLLTSAYVSPTALTAGSRWILGLPSESNSYASNDAAGTSFTNLSRVTYLYDQTAPTATSSASVSNHNTAAFGTSFTARGNLTCVTTWDTLNTTNSISTATKYNTTGSPIEQFLPDNNLTGRSNKISYTDSFSDNAAITNTFAYPTTVTDPDGNFSTLKYRYDLGAVTKIRDPKMIAADTSSAMKGIVTTYDAVGRLKQIDNEFSGASMRYTYDTSFFWANTFTKVDAITEAYSATIFDGHGRARANFSSHPNPGNLGGLRSVYYVYDRVGQMVQTSNPTEVDGSWTPTGDDAAGYIWSQQTYDYKSRPLVTTHQDGSTMTYEYGGCGCTGEATVTITDEVGRKTRQTSDAYLDNTMQVDKSEILQLNSSNQWVVYSTSATVHKPLERKSSIIQAQGEITNYTSCPTGTCREETMEYDGLGRLLKKHRPIESSLDTSGNITAKYYTNYEYYPDGSHKKVTDPRGAIAKFYYNLRGLTTDVKYNEQAQPQGVGATSNASFQYDCNGKRTQMNDGQGQVLYAYDSLSRLQSESRTFIDLAGTYTLSYDYTLYGKMKQLSFASSIRPSDNFTTDYNFDLAGRATSITGTQFAGVTNIADGIQYRAWDAVKAMSFGSDKSLWATYNDRLQVKEFKATSPFTTVTSVSPYTSTTAIQNLVWGQYQYHADGSIKYVQDKINGKFDRAYTFDPVGRLNQALTGQEGRDIVNSTSIGTADGPYKNVYTRNVWGEQTAQSGRFWTKPENVSATWNEARHAGWQYNNSGELVNDGASPYPVEYTFDASGNNTSVHQYTRTASQWFDGNGQEVKKTNLDVGGLNVPLTSYSLRSSLSGQVIAIVNGTGSETPGYNGATPKGALITHSVYNGSKELAVMTKTYESSTRTQQSIFWKIKDPVTGSGGGTWQEAGNLSGAPFYTRVSSAGSLQPNADGINIGNVDPLLIPINEPIGYMNDEPGDVNAGDPTRPYFTLNGFSISNERAVQELRGDSANVNANTNSSALGQVGITGHVQKVFDGLSYPDISHGEDDDGIQKITKNFHDEFIYDNGNELQQQDSPYNPPVLGKDRLEKALEFGQGCAKFFAKYTAAFKAFLKNTDVELINIDTDRARSRSYNVTVFSSGIMGVSRTLTVQEAFGKDMAGNDGAIAAALDHDPTAISKGIDTQSINAIVLGRLFHNGNNSAYFNAYRSVADIGGDIHSVALYFSQQNILRHEFLHIFTHLSDGQLAQKLGLKNVNGESSAKIQNFLDNDCNLSLTKLKAANLNP